MIPIRNAVPSRYPPMITWMLIAANWMARRTSAANREGRS